MTCGFRAEWPIADAGGPCVLFKGRTKHLALAAAARFRGQPDAALFEHEGY
jgi:hypothetical protein